MDAWPSSLDNLVSIVAIDIFALLLISHALRVFTQGALSLHSARSNTQEPDLSKLAETITAYVVASYDALKEKVLEIEEMRRRNARRSMLIGALAGTSGSSIDKLLPNLLD